VTLRPSSWASFLGRSTIRTMGISSLTPTVEVRQIARATRVLTNRIQGRLYSPKTEASRLHAKARKSDLVREASATTASCPISATCAMAGRVRRRMTLPLA
jgi:hypothetical protein